MSYPPPPCTAVQMGIAGNPNCQCSSPLQAFFCMTGHMLECHYPMNCEEAECSHYQRELEAENLEQDFTGN